MAGWLSSLFGRSEPSAAPSPIAPLAVVGSVSSPIGTAQPTQPFDRDAAGVGGFMPVSASAALVYSATALGRIGEFTHPSLVPWIVIEAMGYDGWVNLGEQILAGPLRDQTLYFLEHHDTGLKAEIQACLDRLMFDLLEVGTRALAWGCMPFVLDPTVEDLWVPPSSGSSDTQAKALAGHQHFAPIVHDLLPSDVFVDQKGDRLEWLRYGAARYPATRAFAPSWRKIAGRWEGIGSRRMAYLAWYRAELDELRQARWLDRSVDPPRVGRAPLGTVEINGQQVRCIDIMSSAATAVKGGGVAVFPAVYDKDGNPVWSLEPMQLPDVSDVWHKALTQRNADKLVASMVPPSSAGIGSGQAARVPETAFTEIMRSASEWVAEKVVQPVVDQIHVLNHAKGYAPRVRARELPAIKVKRLTEIFRAVAAQPRRSGKDKEVTLAELVDEQILDDLNVARRATKDAERAPREVGAGNAAGRPRELQGDREKRREDSETIEGEDDTGGDNVDRDERGG